MTLDEFYDVVEQIEKEKGHYCDFIVQIRFKYNERDQWSMDNVIYEIDLDTPYDHVWSYDWWEGQKIIEIINYIPLEDVFNEKEPDNS